MVRLAAHCGRPDLSAPQEEREAPDVLGSPSRAAESAARRGGAAVEALMRHGVAPVRRVRRYRIGGAETSAAIAVGAGGRMRIQRRQVEPAQRGDPP